MVDKLYNRSDVNMVFVSPVSRSNQPFESRDTNADNDLINSLDKVNGTTQGKKHIYYSHKYNHIY